VRVGESLSQAVGEKADQGEEFEVRDTNVANSPGDNCRKTFFDVLKSLLI
jgi:hypothetical protein